MNRPRGECATVGQPSTRVHAMQTRIVARDVRTRGRPGTGTGSPRGPAVSLVCACPGQVGSRGTGLSGEQSNLQGQPIRNSFIHTVGASDGRG